MVLYTAGFSYDKYLPFHFAHTIPESTKSVKKYNLAASIKVPIYLISFMYSELSNNSRQKRLLSAALTLVYLTNDWRSDREDMLRMCCKHAVSFVTRKTKCS